MVCHARSYRHLGGPTNSLKTSTLQLLLIIVPSVPQCPEIFLFSCFLAVFTRCIIIIISLSLSRVVRAIFCHVDIKGAAMNDGVSSHAGIPRSAFPSDVPTFSGHFHKPHTVGDGFIRYVGSPYQVGFGKVFPDTVLVFTSAMGSYGRRVHHTNIIFICHLDRFVSIGSFLSLTYYRSCQTSCRV